MTNLSVLARAGVRLWAASGALAVVLFGCGLLFGDILGSGNYPALDAPAGEVRRYFLENRAEVHALAFFHALAAVALLCFAAFASSRIRAAGPRGAVSFAALAGGATAAGFLLLSALLYWTLAEPEVARARGAARALFVLSYLAGGVAITLPLALFVGAVASAALRPGLLPRWSGWLGVAAAAVSLASASVVLGPANNRSALYGVLLLAALLGFAWLFATSLWLALDADARRAGRSAPRR
jgi:hypothetical protein